MEHRSHILNKQKLYAAETKHIGRFLLVHEWGKTGNKLAKSGFMQSHRVTVMIARLF